MSYSSSQNRRSGGRYSNGRRRRKRSPVIPVLITCAVIFSLVMGVSLYLILRPEPVEVEAPLPTETTVPEPETVVIANNDSASLICSASYSVDPASAAAVSGSVVAKAGEETLTNAELQAYYYLVLSSYRTAEQRPDFTSPLDTQLCPLSDEGLSWQHYLLKEAIQTWYTAQILYLESQTPQPIKEEAYQPDAERHETYVDPSLPLLNFLYQDLDCFTPNQVHQAYLEQLPERLDSLAKQDGWSGAEELASQVFGADSENLLQAARLLNLGYSYFTERTYEMDGSEEALEAFLGSGTAVPQDTRSVDIRQILLIPENASVAPDGTVTADEADWTKCQNAARNLMNSFEQSFLTSRDREANFARTAFENSADQGTSLDGGKYVNIRPGQLTEALDEWCFDTARTEDEYGILRSPYGIHVVYISAIHDAARTAAPAALKLSQSRELLAELSDKYPLTTDFSAAALWTDTEKKASVSLEDVVYADVGFERFPQTMVYLQQDYPHSKYGNRTVGKGGCGVTTMAMLATYMMDQYITPDMLATRYSSYSGTAGTDGDMFRYVPAELGFFEERQTARFEEIVDALNSGRKVISLQIKGRFTTAGHFLLLDRAIDDTTVVVRDSNIFNYKRLSGHQIDCFTKSDILSGNQVFYIMQPKVVTIPACSRCGDPEGTNTPRGMFSTGYICHKCIAAQERRADFLLMCSEAN